MNSQSRLRRTLILSGLIMANFTFAAHATVGEAPHVAAAESQASQTIVAGSSRNTDAAGPQAASSSGGSQTITVGQGQASDSGQSSQAGQTLRPGDNSGSQASEGTDPETASPESASSETAAPDTDAQDPADPMLMPVTEEEAKENAEGALP